MHSGLAGVRVTSQMISMPLPRVCHDFKEETKIIKSIDGTYGKPAQPRRHQEPVVDGGTQP